MRTCSIEGCTRSDRIARGMCHLHYERMRTRGTTAPPPTASERFTAKLVRMPNGCLEWGGSSTKAGYGRLRLDGKIHLAHRVAWKLANGPIPDSLDVLHHCDNPPCCDAEKCLFLGTQADNNADRHAKGRNGDNGERAKTRCPQSHAYDEVNTYIAKDGSRKCRACAAARQAARRAS